MPLDNISLTSLHELADLLEVQPEHLFYLARCREKNYQKEDILKGDGRIRTFYKPSIPLKKVQRLIMKRILQYQPVHTIINSYRKKRDTLYNAKLHAGKDYLLTLDIEDFFPSVHPQRVYPVFKRCNCSDEVASLLTLLTTFRDQLPQGAPTSPALANLVLNSLASRIANLCSKYGQTTSIYGDDTAVSGPPRIQKFQNLLIKITEQEGFNVNEKKISHQPAWRRQVVTGIVVNKQPNVPKKYYRQVRETIYKCLAMGPESQFGKDLEYGKKSLKGKIDYIRRLNQVKAQKLTVRYKQIDFDSDKS
jgi:retron-type reverse transcriptase